MKLPALAIGGAAGLLVLLAVIARNRLGGDCVLCSVGQKVGAAVADVVNGAFVGGVKGVGAAVGVPDTNETACAKALAEGRSWDASFLCPAGTFLAAKANPASPDNFVYSGVNATGAAVSGDPSFNLGGRLWGWFNPTAAAAEHAMLAPSPSIPKPDVWTPAATSIYDLQGPVFP